MAAIAELIGTRDENNEAKLMINGQRGYIAHFDHAGGYMRVTLSGREIACLGVSLFFQEPNQAIWAMCDMLMSDETKTLPCATIKTPDASAVLKPCCTC